MGARLCRDNSRRKREDAEGVVGNKSFLLRQLSKSKKMEKINGADTILREMF